MGKTHNKVSQVDALKRAPAHGVMYKENYEFIF